MSATFNVGMVPDELKMEPRSKGLTTPRKKKPKDLAVITECCTGCAGSPACVEYCPVEDCMFWVLDEDNPPFGRIQVDPILCIGCKKCTSKGPDGSFLDGCPWDAIAMVDTVEIEKEVGVMPLEGGPQWTMHSPRLNQPRASAAIVLRVRGWPARPA